MTSNKACETYVVKAASIARRTLIEDAETWFCELDGVIDGVHE